MGVTCSRRRDKEPRQISRKERKEQLTQRDIEELMGVRRPRYRKSGGTYKQR